MEEPEKGYARIDEDKDTNIQMRAMSRMGTMMGSMSEYPETRDRESLDVMVASQDKDSLLTPSGSRCACVGGVCARRWTLCPEPEAPDDIIMGNIENCTCGFVWQRAVRKGRARRVPAGAGDLICDANYAV